MWQVWRQKSPQGSSLGPIQHEGSPGQKLLSRPSSPGVRSALPARGLRCAPACKRCLCPSAGRAPAAAAGSARFTRRLRRCPARGSAGERGLGGAQPRAGSPPYSSCLHPQVLRGPRTPRTSTRWRQRWAWRRWAHSWPRSSAGGGGGGDRTRRVSGAIRRGGAGRRLGRASLVRRDGMGKGDVLSFP